MAKKNGKSVSKKSASIKLPAPSAPANKSQILSTIVEHTQLAKKQVTGVLDVLSQLIAVHIGKNGPGVFVMPGLFKIMVQKKPATKARKGVNPFTGEPTTFKAKPARNVVKVRPLKSLKDMAK